MYVAGTAALKIFVQGEYTHKNKIKTLFLSSRYMNARSDIASTHNSIVFLAGL